MNTLHVLQLSVQLTSDASDENKSLTQSFTFASHLRQLLCAVYDKQTS